MNNSRFPTEEKNLSFWDGPASAYFGTASVATALRRSEPWIAKQRTQNGLKFYKRGKKFLYKKKDVLEWLKTHEDQERENKQKAKEKSIPHPTSGARIFVDTSKERELANRISELEDKFLQMTAAKQIQQGPTIKTLDKIRLVCAHLGVEPVVEEYTVMQVDYSEDGILTLHVNDPSLTLTFENVKNEEPEWPNL